MAKHEPQFRDRRKPGWFYLDDAVIDRYGSSIGPYGIAVYTGLARHANAQGETSVGYDRLAATLSISRNKVISTLRYLADEGLITIEAQTDATGNPIAANIYTLCIIPEQKREKGNRGVPQDGQGVPRDAPPHAQDASPHPPNGTPVPQDGQGVPPGACEGIVPNHVVGDHVVGVGDRARDALFIELRRRKIGRVKAQAICATPARAADILASIDNLFDPSNPQTMGGVINLLIDAPPIEGHPYERQSRPVQPGIPPDRPRRSHAKNGHNPERDAEFAAQLAELERMADQHAGDMPPL